MDHEFAQVLARSLWLMDPVAFRSMVLRADRATPTEIAAAVQAYQARESGPQVVGDVAVINILGPITHRPSLFSMFFGGTTVTELQAQFRSALADPSVRAIVFRVDSPGGEVSMIPEFADEVFSARGQKPLSAVADTMVASAALWITAQTDTIYTSASGQIGSVGVWTAHEDLSQMLDHMGVKVTLIAYGDKKLEGNPYEPLTDEARASLQAQVDAVGKEFDAAMARGRGVSTADVRASFGQGQIFRGRQAIAVGLADKMGTMGQVMGKMTKGRVMAAMPSVIPGATEVQPGVFVADESTSVFAKDKQAETMEPNEDGECEDGYEMGEDGMCHLMPESAKASASASLCQCVSCGRSSCPCQAQTPGGENCPDDCPTCSPECGCSVQQAARAAADNDALAVTLALSE